MGRLVDSIVHRRRALRWLAPVAVLGAAAIAAGGMITANASPEALPPTTPVDLVADMQSSQIAGFSGTVVAQMSLGLPALPGLTGEASGSSLTSLLAGSHTLRIWCAGADAQRIALLGATDETDVFHSGADVWQWDSSTHTATHLTVPTGETKRLEPLAPPSTPSTLTPSALTPQELASRALAAIDKTTSVTVDGTRVVADRSTYVLVLTPRSSATLVGSVRISVDGKTKLPLAVQVFPRGSATAAVDVAFSDVSFKVPAASSFRFAPPPGVTVHEGVGSASTPDTSKAQPKQPSVIGKGWSAVVQYPASSAEVQKLTKGMLRSLPKVSGAWGTGRLFSSSLVSALITDDGRVFAGAVDPDALYSAAAAHK